MRTTTIAPTGVERRFGVEDIIVSKTDTKGVITYANDVFLRVSAYSRHEVVGRPHNFIRHPSMPRCIFKRLWETIGNGREMFAYILNLAGDGAHYWVLAHVTPSYRDGQIIGYHSNRRAPERSALSTVTDLYAALLTEERRHAERADGLAASSAMLDDMLTRRGQSFDEYVWSLTPTGSGSTERVTA